MTDNITFSSSMSDLSPANIFDLPRFVTTASTQRIADLCTALQQTRTLGLLIGLPGVGKTWAAQHVAQNQPRPKEITASPVLYTTVDVKNTARALLSNLLDCLGPDYRAPVPDMTRLACCWIHRREVALIILDEADRLDKTSLEIIRDIHDRTRCAFLLIGQPDLSLKFRRNEQLINRISLTIEMPLLTFDETIHFLLAWQSIYVSRYGENSHTADFVIEPDRSPEDFLIVKEIYRSTFGNLRRICQFIQEAQRIAGINGQGWVELSVVKITAKLLTGE
ncbi:MAG: AAA family ATPase [Chloroflexi bacterium]|nr:AAA family ATPase [Chloroflexota bacterium]